MATLEDSTFALESIEFSPSYDNAVKINSSIYNRTPAGSKSVRLSGANANEMVALGKALKVVPGDTVYIEVYAKYTQPTTTNSQVGSLFLGALTGLFAPGVGAGLDGSGLQDVFELLGTEGLLFNAGDGVTDNLPKAYLNYILFDDNYIPINFGFEQVTAAGLENGSNVPHEKLALRADVNQSGYLYIYLSNENDKIVDVFFDDLKITHHHSPIVQAVDYYPFGGTFNSYQRTNSAEQRYLYNGIERQTELELGWDLAEFRSYMPELGRFMQIDPVIKLHESPYAWNTNNPVLYADPSGADSTQRANAVAKAQEYIDKKPEGNSYEMGEKGKPGEKVDCSGLASNCVEAGGESDPNKAVAGGQRKADGGQSGVLNIEDNTTKVGTGSAQSGNLITFHKSTGYPYHVGVVNKITKNSDGTYSVTFTHSKGGTGPTQDSFTTGDGSSWANSLHGFYKWDTKPDAVAASTSTSTSTSSNIILGGTATSISQGKSPTVVDRMINSGVPILRDIGNIIRRF